MKLLGWLSAPALWIPDFQNLRLGRTFKSLALPLVPVQMKLETLLTLKTQGWRFSSHHTNWFQEHTDVQALLSAQSGSIRFFFFFSEWFPYISKCLPHAVIQRLVTLKYKTWIYQWKKKIFVKSYSFFNSVPSNIKLN